MEPHPVGSRPRMISLISPLNSLSWQPVALFAMPRGYLSITFKVKVDAKWVWSNFEDLEGKKMVCRNTKEWKEIHLRLVKKSQRKNPQQPWRRDTDRKNRTQRTQTLERCARKDLLLRERLHESLSIPSFICLPFLVCGCQGWWVFQTGYPFYFEVAWTFLYTRRKRGSERKHTSHVAALGETEEECFWPCLEPWRFSKLRM